MRQFDELGGRDQAISDGDDPLILRLVRPEPEVTWVSRSRNAGGWTTAIARKWPEGTTAARCGRCPLAECSLEEGTCLVTVQANIATSDAPAFSRFVAAGKGGGR